MRLPRVSSWLTAAVIFCFLCATVKASLGDKLPDFKNCVEVCFGGVLCAA
jgi:hypothetical protein